MSNLHLLVFKSLILGSEIKYLRHHSFEFNTGFQVHKKLASLFFNISSTDPRQRCLSFWSRNLEIITLGVWSLVLTSVTTCSAVSNILWHLHLSVSYRELSSTGINRRGILCSMWICELEKPYHLKRWCKIYALKTFFYI